jgi:predicted esterase
MPPIENARGQRVVIEHSPDDRTCPLHLAQQARDDLTAAGAKVHFVTYAGGHGWRGAMYPRMKAAFAFLLDSTGPADPEPNQPDEPSPDPAR